MKIPQNWKRWVIRDVHAAHNGFLSRFPLLQQVGSIVGMAHSSLHTKVFLLEGKRQKWDMILAMQTWPEDFIKVVKSIWMITNCAKLRSFQYRLLTHTIITNVHLKIWGIVTYDLCTFCNWQRETILHLFCHCPRVQPLWTKVFKWFSLMDPNVHRNDAQIMFSNVHKNPRSVLNVITIITKFYIYKTRCAQNEPNTFALLDDILLYYRLEHDGARMKGKEQRSNEKWSFAIEIIKHN